MSRLIEEDNEDAALQLISKMVDPGRVNDDWVSLLELAARHECFLLMDVLPKRGATLPRVLYPPCPPVRALAMLFGAGVLVPSNRYLLLRSHPARSPELDFLLSVTPLGELSDDQNDELACYCANDTAVLLLPSLRLSGTGAVARAILDRHI